jgi:hypothetical protein
MKIGDPVTWKGRLYVLRGLDPIGVSDPLAQLELPETSELIAAPLDEVTPPVQPNSEQV